MLTTFFVTVTAAITGKFQMQKLNGLCRTVFLSTLEEVFFGNQKGNTDGADVSTPHDTPSCNWLYCAIAFIALALVFPNLQSLWAIIFAAH